MRETDSCVAILDKYCGVSTDIAVRVASEHALGNLRQLTSGHASLAELCKVSKTHGYECPCGAHVIDKLYNILSSDAPVVVQGMATKIAEQLAGPCGDEGSTILQELTCDPELPTTWCHGVESTSGFEIVRDKWREAGFDVVQIDSASTNLDKLVGDLQQESGFLNVTVDAGVF